MFRSGAMGILLYLSFIYLSRWFSHDFQRTQQRMPGTNHFKWRYIYPFVSLLQLLLCLFPASSLPLVLHRLLRRTNHTAYFGDELGALQKFLKMRDWYECVEPY